MKNLFIIDGAAGTGKTDLIKYIDEKYNDVSYIKKTTTRKKRKEEVDLGLQLDLIHVEKDYFDSISKVNAYIYKYGNESYCFYKKDIHNAFSKSDNVFLVIRNKPLVERLKNDFPDIRIVLTYIYSDKENVLERLKKDGYDSDSIGFRVNRLNTAWDDYLRHNDIYQEVLINNSSVVDFQKLIDWLISKYQQENPNLLEINNLYSYNLIKPLVGFKNKIIHKLKQFPFEKNVFLMMKFRDSNKRIFDFIEKKLSEYGFNCVRADQDDWQIIDNVYNPIAVLYCCKYGIALFDEPESGNNFSPNVAYELGMMHQQVKECLVLRHTSLPSMPFDLVKDLHKPYSDNLEVEPIIRSWIKSLCSNEMYT